jgi:hypothetical protein
MATVKFSGELRDRIINAAKAKFNGAVVYATNDPPKGWGPRLYDIIFGQFAEGVQGLPSYWYDKVSDLHIQSVAGEPVGLVFPLGKNRPYPANMPESKQKDLLAHKRSSYSQELVLHDDPAFEEFRAEVAAWRKRVTSAKARQEEFANSVSAVINAYVTLAPALKAWPPLWDLIPDDVKEKHKKIVEREKSAPVLDVDLDRMTALASFTKIRQGDDQ